MRHNQEENRLILGRMVIAARRLIRLGPPTRRVGFLRKHMRRFHAAALRSVCSGRVRHQDGQADGRALWIPAVNAFWTTLQAGLRLRTRFYEVGLCCLMESIPLAGQSQTQ